MNFRHLSGCLAIATLGVLLSTDPLLADIPNHGIPSPIAPNIDAIFHTGPDFFEQGQEQFELEIERLLQRQFESEEPPLLTLDESVRFDTDAIEDLLELPPVEPDANWP